MTVSQLDFESLGHEAHLAGQHDRVVWACSQAIERGQEVWSNYYFLGLSLRALGRQEEAISAFSSALRLAPDNVDVAGHLLGATFSWRGLPAADDLYNRLSAGGFPGLKERWEAVSEECIFRAVEDLAAKGRLAEAEKLCRTGRHFECLGREAHLAGQHDRAVRCLILAIKLGASNWAIYCKLGRSLSANQHDRRTNASQAA